MAKGNTDNLIPNSERTPEERKANAKKAGKASGEARRKKKALKEIAEAFGAAQAPDTVKAKMQAAGLSKKKNITLDEALILAQYGQALKGNTRAATYIAEVKGERVQKIEQVIEDKSIDRMKEDFEL